MLVAQGNVNRRFNLIAHYTLSSAKTWGCLLGELFDYVNGVCDPLNPFGPGDYGPSGEDVTHRFVLAGTLHLPGGLDVTTMTQAEISAADYADDSGGRSRGGQRSEDDARSVSRDAVHSGRSSREPADPLRRAVGDSAVRGVLQSVQPQQSGRELCDGYFRAAESGERSRNATASVPDPGCTTLVPITNPQKQLLFPSGGLGDFFGPGTTVGIPFAAQLGVRVNF